MFNELKNRLRNGGNLSLTIKVHPGAKGNKIKEIMADGVIKIDIAAAPERGKANSALIKFLAEEFGVSKNNIKITSGQSSRLKLVKINL